MSPVKDNSQARQRILEAADRLFYEQGIRAVGIDRIIAEAKVAKMTLYAHFASKDELILAVLKHRESTFDAWFGQAMERHAARSKDPVKVFFAALKEWFESPGFRGCPFINASVETPEFDHPCSAFVREHKESFSALLRGIVEKSLGKDASRVAPAVSLLVEGAIVTAVIQGKSLAADVARDASLKLIEQARGG